MPGDHLSIKAMEKVVDGPLPFNEGAVSESYAESGPVEPRRSPRVHG